MDNRPPPKFKVGDKVKLKDILANGLFKHYIGEYEVEEVRPIPDPFFDEDLRKSVYWFVGVHNACTWFEDRLELVYPKTPISLEDLI